MKPDVKKIKNYWLSKYPMLDFDSETLEAVYLSLTDKEKSLLRLWDGFRVPDDDTSFTLSKALNRHNDVCGGVTDLNYDKGQYVVEITSKSSISELNITNETLRACNRSLIYHIEDINKEELPNLSFKAIAELTAAILEAESVSVDEDNGGQCVVPATPAGGDNLAKE